MTESLKKIIKYFCDRFLEIDYYPKKLSDVLDLSVETMKKFDDEVVKNLHEIDINSIRDITKLESKVIDKLIKKKKIDPIILKNAIIGANLISNAWNKRALYNKTAKNKVVIAGLDFAGKTSLINRLINDYSYKDMINLEPTIGVNIEEYQTQRLNLIIWDLGGQKEHMNEYLEDPEKYFVQPDVLIFVIDSQDDVRYDLALKYLSDIMDTLEYLKENPFLMILLNKTDSDILKDPEFQIKLEYLTEKLTELITSKVKQWNYDLIQTSLYNIYSNTPEIAKNIKTIFSFQKDIVNSDASDVVNKDIQDKLEKIMDINLRLMDKVASELSGMRSELSKMYRSGKSSTASSIPFETIAYEYLPRIESSKKKKKKKSGQSGPPERLKTLPKPELVKKEKEKNKVTDQDEILKVKESLIPPTPSGPPLTTPPTPNTTPAPVKSENSGLYLRSQVMTELKDIFAKRGVTN